MLPDELTITKPYLQLEKYLNKQKKIDLLRFITCGSVDNGKSTLIGRMLWESKQILEDQLIALKQASQKYGTQGDNIDFSLLVDGLTAEREQGITIDVAYRYFTTDNRRFIIADTPGHEQYTRNMISAASSADVAVILVDASKGILTQTKRHIYLVSLMGIKHIVLAVNKMDLVNYAENSFKKILKEFNTITSTLQFSSKTAIPISALNGDNVFFLSKNMPWYSGKTLLKFLETITVNYSDPKRFIFPVQLIIHPSASFRGISGSVAEGAIEIGEEVGVAQSRQKAKIKRLITQDGDIAQANSPLPVTIILDKEIDISRGDILHRANKPITVASHFEVTLIWMDQNKGFVGRNYILKLATQEVNASVTDLKYKINVNNQRHEIASSFDLNDIYVCKLETTKPIAFDSFRNSKSLGAFILIDRFTNATVAAGLIHHSLYRGNNIHRHLFTINRQDRERLKGHQGKVIWFTGLSGSGKSTIANALEVRLHNKNFHTYLLDGDIVRIGLNKNLGFNMADRIENIRRVAEVAKLMLDAGLIVIMSFISPFQQERETARDLIGSKNFIEVFINTPLALCEQRDPKGLYQKARAGKLANMSGISSPYEPPTNPDIEIDGGSMTVEEAVEKIISSVI